MTRSTDSSINQSTWGEGSLPTPDIAIPLPNPKHPPIFVPHLPNEPEDDPSTDDLDDRLIDRLPKPSNDPDDRLPQPGNTPSDNLPDVPDLPNLPNDQSDTSPGSLSGHPDSDPAIELALPGGPKKKPSIKPSNNESNNQSKKQSIAQSNSQVNPHLKAKIDRLIQQLPPASLVCAYGSAVFPQPSADTQSNNQSINQSATPSTGSMIDLIIGVDDLEEWHSINLSMNPSHYSFMKYFGARSITELNSRPAYIYYNQCTIDDQPIKYGVISIDRLVDDMKHWTTLYVSGRLHKPVYVASINQSIKQSLEYAQSVNLNSAFMTAMLLADHTKYNQSNNQSNNQFKESITLPCTDLYEQICGLSYTGDVRVGVAEDPSKVANIVRGSIHGLIDMYKPIVDRHPQLITIDQSNNQSINQSTFTVNESSYARATAFAQLARHLRSQVYRRAHQQSINQSIKLSNKPSNLSVDHSDFDPPPEFDHLFVSLDRRYQRDCLRSGLSDIIRMSSMQQSVKGVMSAGIRKSAAYAIRKIGKAFK